VYFLIGISLLFAYLLGINLVATTLSVAIWRILAGRSVKWRSRTRSNILFALRILPVAIALVSIFLFILPAYLLFEPHSSGETITYKLGIIVALSLLGLVAAVGRILVSRLRTRKMLQDWLSRSEAIAIEGVSMPVYRMLHTAPVVAVVGILRPRIFVAERLLEELEDAELAAAIAHEAGHITSRDNLKRSILRMCGDLLIYPFGRRLDRAWSASAEIAADESVAERGGQRAALDLASALIKIGRMARQETEFATPLGSFLIEAQTGPLSSRVERLLKMADSGWQPGDVRAGRAAAISLILVSASLIPFAFSLEFLAIVHSATESILAILS
jgi:Zn-dependent protease with chaperone function